MNGAWRISAEAPLRPSRVGRHGGRQLSDKHRTLAHAGRADDDALADTVGRVPGACDVIGVHDALLVGEKVALLEIAGQCRQFSDIKMVVVALPRRGVPQVAALGEVLEQVSVRGLHWREGRVERLGVGTERP